LPPDRSVTIAVGLCPTRLCGSITAGGTSSGFVNGLGTVSAFSSPRGVAVNNAGYIFVADSGNLCIRMISPAGNVSLYAGRGAASGNADGVGAAAYFNNSYGVGFAPGGAGALYVAEAGANANRVRVVVNAPLTPSPSAHTTRTQTLTARRSLWPQTATAFRCWRA
jgi:hypothetical protein